MLKDELQEIQGLYGSFSLSERILQKIWLQGDFDQSTLRTESGKRLRVIDPGRWNLLEGPDFVEAQLELEDVGVVGDVEVHFHLDDWHLHAHGANPNFSDVCLHVVLYPEKGSKQSVITAKGTVPELLYLLPLLERDLEDYAVDDALLGLEQVEDTEWMLRFMERALDERRAILREGASARWTRKVNFARKRVQGSSWLEACHHYCLEVLGYARNRAPMARVALSHRIEDFSEGRVEVEALFAEERGRWRLSGLRPANHPRHRLAQYIEICRMHPDWPERLKRVLDDLDDLDDFKGLDGSVTVDASLSGAAFRKQHGLAGLAERIAQKVFSGKISAKRLNTLVCDALLPLAQASGLLEAEALWWHWPAGDTPERLHAFLKQSQVIDRAEPFSNGQVQGAVQLMIER